jgi:alanyl-tRNA synthetase
MNAAEIRRRFLTYFEQNGHAVRPSASLVPAGDPTLLFTNAGMVPFKKIFLGLEEPDFGRRATTAQKCVRAGGKHNDLEQVGHTARHHTFFEMLGNFSFGDYFKRDAIAFAWEFTTKELKLDPAHLYVTVFEEDDEARKLWSEIAGLPDNRIYGLGAKDNFWQMADTGPCGPCSEIYVDMAAVASDWRTPDGATGEWTEDRTEFTREAFELGAEAGRFLEFWNLVFMQFDRQQDGTLVPLPRPSVDTGAGLERITAILQGVTNNFHTDLFKPLIEKAEAVIGIQTALGAADGRPIDPASFRVIADHARTVAFLLADGVFPSNEGRGYVLRRILRRGVRHAWLLGRREPTLVDVAETVIETMGEAYPELRQRSSHILQTTRAEEERFLATIDAGMAQFEALAPVRSTQGSTQLRGTISGEDAFRLYDTFGFPIDLTELMARERNYTVDVSGFEAALSRQRTQSREDRESRKLSVSSDELSGPEGWESQADDRASTFVGYDTVEIETQVTAVRHLEGNRVAMLLRETPFYAESGGQISDRGEILGEGWRMDVEDVRRVDGRNAAIGVVEGELKFGRVVARIPTTRRRDTERNHTATHLLHAALREVLGEHVHQAGSLVAPDRLRFDFTHHGPVPAEALADIESRVNALIFEARPVTFSEMSYSKALEAGAMALFGEKYGDTVRVVTIPGYSMELCGGTHVRNTSEISIFRIVQETGVAAGVRRIEAATGARALEQFRAAEGLVRSLGEKLKVAVSGPEGLHSLERRIDALLEERRSLQKKLEAAMRGGGGGLQSVLSSAEVVNGSRIASGAVSVDDAKGLQAMGDALREQLGSGVGVLAASFQDKHTLLVVVTDDLKDRGLKADALVREVAAVAGGKGGGKPHMAQAGIPEASGLQRALERAPDIIRARLTADS